MAITVAYDRLEVDLTLDKLKKISQDVLNEFGVLEQDIIITALRNGALGKYGKTYKLNVQEICIWIREYLKTDEGYFQLNANQKKLFPRQKPKEDRL